MGVEPELGRAKLLLAASRPGINTNIRVWTTSHGGVRWAVFHGFTRIIHRAKPRAREFYRGLKPSEFGKTKAIFNTLLHRSLPVARSCYNLQTMLLLCRKILYARFSPTSIGLLAIVVIRVGKIVGSVCKTTIKRLSE